MMKLIAVDCSRATDTEDDHPRRCVVFARDKDEAERLCREAHVGYGVTRFHVQEPVEGPFPGPARVIHYAGGRLSAAEMPSGEAVAA
jgi:hypothetical protein